MKKEGRKLYLEESCDNIKDSFWSTVPHTPSVLIKLMKDSKN